MSGVADDKAAALTNAKAGIDAPANDCGAYTC